MAFKCWLLVSIYWLLATGVLAQPLRDDIRKNIRCSANSLMAYPGPQQQRQSPAPKGKRPFYISHYGRYGSCYLSDRKDYETPYRMLATADSASQLTPLGCDVLHRLDQIRHDAINHWGELSDVGSRQHQHIMRRMVEHFPEVFTDTTTVDARSMTTLPCMLSMEYAMIQLSRMCPTVKIHHNATRRDLTYLNQRDKRLELLQKDSAVTAALAIFRRTYTDNNRLMQLLFRDMGYVREYVDDDKLYDGLFLLASNIQNTLMRNQLTLYDLFTDDEIYRNWERDNARWYAAYGPSPVTGGQLPFSQRNLLRKIIEQADSCIRMNRPSVQLRYGSETALLPLICLLELDGYNLSENDLENLDRHGWVCYKIVPMAANIQFIFYRNGPQDDDVLFKVLLNENETGLPLPSNLAPYYHWADFRDYYLKKLDAYEER